MKSVVFRVERTHEPNLPIPYGPSPQEIFHHEYVRDHALIISEGQSTYRRENGATKCIGILS